MDPRRHGHQRLVGRAPSCLSVTNMFLGPISSIILLASLLFCTLSISSQRKVDSFGGEDNRVFESGTMIERSLVALGG